MLSIIETLGWLSGIQKWITLFEYNLEDKSRFQRYFLGVLRRLPIIYINIYSIYDIIKISQGELTFISFDSVTSEAVSAIDLVVFKIVSILILIYFTIYQRKHIQIVREITNFEKKWCYILQDVSKKRRRARFIYFFQFLFLFLFNFSYNIFFYFKIEEYMGRHLSLIIWYFALVCQSANIDFVALYLVGYINVFAMNLDIIHLKRFTDEEKLVVFKFLPQYFDAFKRIDSLFGIIIFIILMCRLVEATTYSCLVLLFSYELTLNQAEFVGLFAICCAMWVFGNILIMLHIASCGESIQSKEVSMFIKLAALHIDDKNRTKLKDCINFGVKTFLLKHLHEPKAIIIGRFVHINYKFMFSTLSVLVANMAIFIQFCQYEASYQEMAIEEKLER
uniref:Gustatory receptor n=1 Tax=Lutzomyia longipalpis TaxID=7200 RepID=A0A3F2ZD69_LUTLO